MRTIIGMGIYIDTYRAFKGFYKPVQARYDEEEWKEAMRDEEWAKTVPIDRIILPLKDTATNNGYSCFKHKGKRQNAKIRISPPHIYYHK